MLPEFMKLKVKADCAVLSLMPESTICAFVTTKPVPSTTSQTRKKSSKYHIYNSTQSTTSAITSMARNLLDLPREIRNIYKCALTEDDGVCHRKDQNSVAWLCHQRVEEPVEHETWKWHDHRTDDREEDEGQDEDQGQDKDDDDEEQDMNNEDSMENDGTRPGIENPFKPKFAETRVQILVGTDTIANQTQFVCRRLASETRDLTPHKIPFG
jgi:hypothetical protein